MTINRLRRPSKGVTKRGRDAITGRFISVAEARRRRKTAIVETVKRKRRRR